MMKAAITSNDAQVELYLFVLVCFTRAGSIGGLSQNTETTRNLSVTALGAATFDNENSFNLSSNSSNDGNHSSIEAGSVQPWHGKPATLTSQTSLPTFDGKTSENYRSSGENNDLTNISKTVNSAYVVTSDMESEIRDQHNFSSLPKTTPSVLSNDEDEPADYLTDGQQTATSSGLLSSSEHTQESISLSAITAIGYTESNRTTATIAQSLVTKEPWTSSPDTDAQQAVSADLTGASQADMSTEQISNIPTPAATYTCENSSDELHLLHWRAHRTVTVPLPLTVPVSCVSSAECHVTTLFDQHVTAQTGDRVQVVFSVVSQPDTTIYMAQLQLNLHQVEFQPLTASRHLVPTRTTSGVNNSRCFSSRTKKPSLIVSANTRAYIPRAFLTAGRHVFYGSVNASLEECFMLTVDIRGARCGPLNECSGNGHCVISTGQTEYACRCCRGHRGAVCSESRECGLPFCQASSAGSQCEISQCSCRDRPDLTSNCSQSGMTSTSALSPSSPPASETVADPCTSSPCQHGGSCMDQSRTRFKCRCPLGYVGDVCQLRILPLCAIYPCYNGGTCSGNGSFYHCSCAPGHTGKHCEGALAGLVLPGYDSTEQNYRRHMAWLVLSVLSVAVTTTLLVCTRHGLANLLSPPLKTLRAHLEAYGLMRAKWVPPFKQSIDDQRRTLLELGLNVHTHNGTCPCGGPDAGPCSRQHCDESGSARHGSCGPASTLQWPASSMTTVSTPVHLWQDRISD